MHCTIFSFFMCSWACLKQNNVVVVFVVVVVVVYSKL